MPRVKHPRTPHHPSSPGVGSDDRVALDLSQLGEVVITEKMDGENTTLYRDGLHARSLEESARHPSRAWVAAFQARIGWTIPEDWRVCGENLYARHAIAYDALPSYFLGFSAWQDGRCAGWDETLALFERLGVTPVPVLWRGPWSEAALADIVARLDLERQEGVVVRSTASFDRAAFNRHVVKWVRPGHVRSDRHWRHGPMVPNGLVRGP